MNEAKQREETNSLIFIPCLLLFSDGTNIQQSLLAEEKVHQLNGGFFVRKSPYFLPFFNTFHSSLTLKSNIRR